MNPFNFIMPFSYYCPRCKTQNVIEHPETIECPNCLLEFDKKLIGVIPDNEILAHGEIDTLIGAFDELKNPETAKKFFDSIMKDLEDEN